MEDLIKLQAFQIKALQERNEYLENENKQAKQLFQEFINEFEVKEPNVLDTMFNNPMEQLNNLY
tara:strand:+ start:410 stop:601 length:192 start_codon:yes stop_codon:yes gene_type:complete